MLNKHLVYRTKDLKIIFNSLLLLCKLEIYQKLFESPPNMPCFLLVEEKNKLLLNFLFNPEVRLKLGAAKSGYFSIFFSICHS